MVSTIRLPARLLVALVVLCALLATGAAAVAQNDDPGGIAAAQPNDGTGKKKGKAQAGDEDDLPECEADEQVAAGQETPDEPVKPGDTFDTDGDDEADCVIPPRCEDNEVDLAPNDADPNCVDRAELNRLLANFEAAAAEEAAALDELAGALEQLGELNDQLVELRLRLGEVQLRLAAARADEGFAAIRADIAGESLDDVTTTLRFEEDRLREQAVEAYIGGNEVEQASQDAMLELEGFSDKETAREYASAVIGEQLATIDKVDALRNAVDHLTEIVAAVEEQAEADAARVADIESQVDELIVRQRDLVAAAEAEAEAIAEAIAEIQARKSAYADELRISGAGGGAIGEILRTRQNGQVPPADPSGILAIPLENTRFGSPFGPRVHPIFNDTRLHAGIDMSGNSGDPILASADGVVAYAEETSGYGNVVVVDHGNSLATLYAHMSADAVSAGQDVLQGDLVGFVGSTGYSTGPHLHFEVRVFGTPVDPMLYLDFT